LRLKGVGFYIRLGAVELELRVAAGEDEESESESEDESDFDITSSLRRRPPLNLTTAITQLLVFKLEQVHRLFIYLPSEVLVRIRTKRSRKGSRIYTKLFLFSHSADKLGASATTIKKLMRLLPYKIKTGYRGIRICGEKVTPKKGKSKKF
jgi:hypothetical protein